MTYAIALIAATILFATIAWRDVRHGMYLIAALLPTYLLRFSVGPIPMTFLETMILIVLFIYIVKFKPSLRSVVPEGWMLPMGLLLLAATVGIVIAPDHLSALGIWKAFYVEPMMLFLVIVDLARRDAKTTDNIAAALAAGGLFVAAIAIAQKITGLGIPVPWDAEGRVTSVFPYPNAVGLYLAPVVVMGLLKLESGNWKLGRTRNFYFIISSFLSLLAIILAQSEAAIAAVVATLFIAAVASKRSRNAAVLVAAAATAVIAAVSPLRHYALEKLAFRDYSETVRLSQWTETVDLLKDHPIVGTGLSGYPTAMIPYHRATHIEIFQYPHTLLLNIWVELGMLGLAAFALLAWRVIQSPRSIAFFPLLAMTLHSFFDVPYFKNDLAAMTWIFLAVVAASYAKNSLVRR